jgi:hypothetical protein
MIEAVVERCAGIDEGKKVVLVCGMMGGAISPKRKLRSSARFASELDRLAVWIFEQDYIYAVMESTRNY